VCAAPTAMLAMPVSGLSSNLGVSLFMSEPVKITVRPNGPLRVEGPIVLTDADGNQWDLTGKPAISLCRCGASENRPFCDGSHKRIEFQCVTSPATLPTTLT
jgi:CDGSH-type Zn-finger protein